MKQAEKINEQLYKKLAGEYEAFIDGLKQLPVEDVIEHSYEKVLKEDILLSIEYRDLPCDQARALLCLQNPLDELYVEWLDTDCSHMDMLNDCIDNRAASALTEMKSKVDRER